MNNLRQKNNHNLFLFNDDVSVNEVTIIKSNISRLYLKHLKNTNSACYQHIKDKLNLNFLQNQVELNANKDLFLEKINMLACSLRLK